jgi:hypothetical protein
MIKKLIQFIAIPIFALSMLLTQAGCNPSQIQPAVETIAQNATFYKAPGDFSYVAFAQYQGYMFEAVISSHAWGAEVQGGFTNWTEIQRLTNAAINANYKSVSWWSLPPSLRAGAISGIIRAVMAAMAEGGGNLNATPGFGPSEIFQNLYWKYFFRGWLPA